MVGFSGAARERVDVLLVCSAGGHVLQLHELRPAWSQRSRLWVTHDKDDTRSLLAGEQVRHAYGPTTRNVGNLLRNLVLAWHVIAAVRPAVIITTGAALAVPFGWIGRLRGCRVVYIESLTRVDSPSLSCRLVRRATDRLYVQWPELVQSLPEARYAGNVFGTR